MSETLAPATAEEAAAAIRAAALAGVKLDIVGADTKAGLGRPREGARRMTSAALSGLVFYAPAEMTLSAKAGTPIETIEAAIAEHRQRLPFEPMRPSALWGTNAAPTLGGMVATNLSGPRRFAAGAVRDAVLGLTLVNGLGQTIRCGGRVMKNVTGLDLTKLNCGAHGTLGFLTEATIRLTPQPETETTLVIPGLEPAVAVEAMTRALATPFAVSGAAWLERGMGRDVSRTALRLEGFLSSVADRARRLEAALAEFGEALRLEGELSAALWRAIRDAEFIAEPRERAVWRLSLPPSRAPDLLARLGATALARSLDWGGGLAWVASEPSEAAATALRAAVKAVAGHATLMRAPQALRAHVAVFEPPSALALKFSRAVKASFDPGGLINFGRMYPGV